MARALWSGSLSFGLVNVPVALVSAVRDLDLHFRQLHAKDGAPIEQRRVCSKEGREVAYEEIGRGYELDDGTQVVLTDEELAAVAPRRTRTIDISAFVDAADLDPIRFDHPYFLVPTGEGDGGRRAYALLVQVLERTDQVALGRVVLRTKEYLVAVRVRDGRLALTTMLFDDEIRRPEDVPTGGAKPERDQLEQAAALIDQLTVDWDPSRYRDRYRERLEAIVARKKQGRRITMPEEERLPEPAPDLMEALKRSLDDVRSGRFAKDDLGELSKDELYERAQERDIAGRSSMTKDELLAALRG